MQVCGADQVGSSKVWKRRGFLGALIATALSVASVACLPVPRHTLTLEEKDADLMWIFSHFDEQYAPLEYKATRYKFDYEKLKKDYLAKAALTQTNEEFYLLMMSFVAEFHDAHTSASLTAASLPDRAQISYFGFSGVRKGKNLLVKDLLPTIDAKNSHFPISVGDEISAIDGVALPDVIKAQMLPYRNLGNDESNLTFHMNKIFNRISTDFPMPTEKTATLKVVKPGTDSREVELKLPWIVRDLYQFRLDQAAATAKKNAQTGQTETQKNPEKSIYDQLNIADTGGALDLSLQLVGFDGQPTSLISSLMKISAGTAGRNIWDGFRFFDSAAGWTAAAQAVSPAADATPVTPAQKLAKTRQVPKGAHFIEEAITYPAYWVLDKVRAADGKPTGETKRIGYIYLDTFSPAGEEDKVVAEMRKTILVLNDLGAKDVIIDLLNNGGGSLTLGLRIAQALSNKPIWMPGMKYRLSDTWLDEFQQTAIGGNSDANREIARRIYVELKTQAKTSNRLSTDLGTDGLGPFTFEPTAELDAPMHAILLVNEMCASMCDIFTMTLKDNGMATVVGSQTMGAGGNVVSYDEAPNSHLTLRQTESLFLRKDGTYLENNGVVPDLAIAVNESSDQKYEPVRQKAYDSVFKLPAPSPSPSASPSPGASPSPAPSPSPSPADVPTVPQKLP